MEKFIITESAYNEILFTVGTRKPESGGILLGSRNDYIVKKFVFDATGTFTDKGYDPDTKFLNIIIANEWRENNLQLLGFLHSHPRGIARLSGDFGNNIGDIGYIRAIFKATPALQKLLTPIMFTSSDGGEIKIIPFIANRDDEENYYEAELAII